ncbi:UNVERIFIED_CONTAM: hypothetical protein FKN15_066913 [Acipenser sinensis]
MKLSKRAVTISLLIGTLAVESSETSRRSMQALMSCFPAARSAKHITFCPRPLVELGIQCKVCTMVVKKVEKLIPDDAKKDDLINKLHVVCSKINFFQSACKKFVSKYSGKLVEELKKKSDPIQICRDIGLCKGILQEVHYNILYRKIKVK